MDTVKLSRPCVGRGEKDRAIGGMGLRGVTSGKVRTVQHSPVAGGDIFGQHDRIVASHCQSFLLSGCRGQSQGRGQRASRSRPEPLLLPQKSNGEIERGRMGGKTCPKTKLFKIGITSCPYTSK